jgi:hypothetical protein
VWTILAWICAGAISLLSLKLFTIPYLWIFLVCAMALFATAATDKRRRALWFNVACLSVGLAVFEYYLWTSSSRAYAAGRVEEGSAAERLYAPHDQLGWAPQPATVVTEKLSFEGEVIFDAAYTIGPNGLRISSPAMDGDEPPQQCVLFFGDSFTFGQGLADDESLPYRVDEKLPQRYRTYNFGVNGYGPHQMLSALQHGRVEDAVQCDPTEVSHVFYQGITDHVSRSAGLMWWEARGPRYVLTQHGVTLAGRLEDQGDYRSLYQTILSQMFKSMIYKSIVQGRYVRQYSRDDIDLLVRIIDESRNTVRSDFPSAKFHVLWWDEDNLDNQTIRDGFKERGITVHLMSDILPNYRPDDVNRQYRLHERDMHPNATAVELIAQYVVREILGEPRISLRSATARGPVATLAGRRGVHDLVHAAPDHVERDVGDHGRTQIGEPGVVTLQ